jgi:hypothetical protein
MVRAYRSNEFSPFGPEFPANIISTCDGLVSARYNSSNKLVVVWRSSYGGSFSNAVCIRRFDSNLAIETGEWKANETTHANNWPTSLSIGANDEALITWDSSISKYSRNIYARLLDRDGDPIGHEFRVNQFAKGSHTMGWEACPHTAVLGNGNLVVGWGGDGANGNGIYLTMFKRLDDKIESLKKP